jgi:hypothetical protein
MLNIPGSLLFLERGSGNRPNHGFFTGRQKAERAKVAGQAKKPMCLYALTPVI